MSELLKSTSALLTLDLGQRPFPPTYLHDLTVKLLASVVVVDKYK